MSQQQPRPGSLVLVRTAPPPRTVPTDTGVWFVAGLTDRGPLVPKLVHSLNEFIQVFGKRQSYSVLYDAVEMFFREGGNLLQMSRVVGPAAVVATVNLLDATAGISLVVTAKGPGSYANNFRITVTTVGSGFVIQLTDTSLPAGQQVLETSPTLATQAAAVAWSAISTNLNIALGASTNNPDAVSNAAMTLGADDRTNISDVHWNNALNRFTKDLGPGQVTQIGRTTNQAYLDTLAHAAARNRTAILDGPDTSTIATLQSAATTLRGSNDTYGGMFAPWLVIPGLTPNTTRIVPPSALVAARIAALDGTGASPNAPAAGWPEGVSSYALGLSQVAYDDGSGIDTTRDTMYANGINQIALRYGSIEVFGWRTLTDPVGTDQDWLNLGNRRLAMAMIAEGLAIAEPFILKELNPSLFSKYQGELQAMCSRYYDLGSLYDGGTGRPEDAYIVDTTTVNTPDTIANKELHGQIAARMSQDAELVVLEIVKTAASQDLVAA